MLQLMFSISWLLYQIILYSWIAFAIMVFFILLKMPAPYGRHTTAKWGPLISNKWGWMIMELPVLIVLWLFIAPAISKISTVSWLMIGLFCMHYINRIFVFPFRIHTPGKKIPLVIVFSAVFFNIMNGFPETAGLI